MGRFQIGTWAIDGNNSYDIDLSNFYDHLSELYADQADDGILNHSNATDTRGNDVDYSDNAPFVGSQGLMIQGTSADSSSYTAENAGVTCFTSGTRIATPRGDVQIDDLRIGDLVLTADNGPQPIRWIGQHRLTNAELRADRNLRPVLLKAEALGNVRELLSRTNGASDDGGPDLLRTFCGVSGLAPSPDRSRADALDIWHDGPAIPETA